MKKDFKKPFITDWKQTIGIHFCGQVFSVVDWLVSVERVSLIPDILEKTGQCNFVYGVYGGVLNLNKLAI